MDSRVTTGADDWKAQILPAARQRIISKIAATLKKYWLISNAEDSEEIQTIATRFEEELFTSATSQVDYLKKISLKILSFESTTLHAPAISNATATTELENLLDELVINDGATLPQET